MRSSPSRLRRGQRRSRCAIRLHCEGLETRQLLTATFSTALLPPPLETTPDDTLDHAADLGLLQPGSSVEQAGRIGDSALGDTDVDWLAFVLPTAAHIRLSLQGQPGPSPLRGLLSLYNANIFDFGDSYNPTFHRRLGRAEAIASDEGADLKLTLAPGAYYVAISGGDNHDFHPFLADSGLGEEVGDYRFSLQVEEIALDADAGPQPLSADPAPGASVERSPFVLRIGLSAPLDPATLLADDNVRLEYSATGDFDDGSAQPVPLAGVRLAESVNELQITPAAPLGPGWYRVRLRGDALGGLALAGLDGCFLGQNAAHPTGADFDFTFQVTGAESDGSKGGDDVPEHARDLGDVSDGALVREEGAIGDDPTAPVPFHASDVDLYHFRLSGPGRFALVAEAFAARIGSPLDAALTLFRAGPDGGLILVASNANSGNTTPDSRGGGAPLASDAVLFSALEAGDYYLAVSSEGNVPLLSGDSLVLPGTDGVFDPMTPHSGTGGFSTGPYVLVLRAEPSGAAPRVSAVAPAAGAVLTTAPQTIEVKFDGPVNLRQLAAGSPLSLAGHLPALDAVIVEGPDGRTFAPRLADHDPVTHRATFLLYERLPAGAYTLRLSGSRGLADLAGTPLAGNDPSGDFLVPFAVAAAAPGSADDPRAWDVAGPTTGAPFDLGHLFPDEVAAPGLTFVRSGSDGATAESFRIQLGQTRTYFVRLDGPELPVDAQLVIRAANGDEIARQAVGQVADYPLFLTPGSYLLEVTGLAGANATYRIHIEAAQSFENPTALVVGAGPVVRYRLVTGPTSAPPSSSPANRTTAPTSSPPIGPVVGPVAPTGSTSAGVVKAGGATVTGGAATAMALPGNSLLAQNSSPIGGLSVRGADGAVVPERFALRPAGGSAGESLVQALIATYGSLDGSWEESESSEPTPEPSAEAQEIVQGLDLYFGLWEFLGARPSPAPQSSGPAEAEVIEDDEEPALAPTTADDDAFLNGWSAVGLVAVAAFRPDRRRRATSPRRRRTE